MRDDMLIAVDHEGGRVQRFRTDGFTVLPAPCALGELWDRDAWRARDGDRVRLRARRRTARVRHRHELHAGARPELRRQSSVIGDRALHRDPRVVTVLRKNLNHGLLLAGMANCGKHFPGHGFVAADSHVALPIDDRPLERILAADAAPYDWLGMSLASVIPAHVIYTQVDEQPAGFSARWLRDILRGRLGFDGAIFSDDLSMEARARRRQALTEAATAALTAGCDMVLICNQSIDGGAAVDALLDELLAAEAAGGWQADPDSDVRRLNLLPQTAPIVWDDLMHDPAYQRSLERLP